MKKLFLVACLMIGLSGCYVAPYRGHDDGDRNYRDGGVYQQNDTRRDGGRQDDRYSRDERNHQKDRGDRNSGQNDGRNNGHGGGDDHDGYH